jgi:hypothetical protein
MAGCSGANVKRDYDPSVDFQTLKTYAWHPQAGKDAVQSLDNTSLLDARVRGAVESALGKKGLQPGADAPPDAWVTYHYVVEKYADERGGVRTGVGIGGGSRGTFGGVSIGVGSGGYVDEQETLTIDLLDPKTDKLLWRGFVRQPLERVSNPDKASLRVNKTVEAILSKFPPKKKR